MASGWYDVFCNQTVDDFMEAQKSSRQAKREGRAGNDNVCFFFLARAPTQLEPSSSNSTCTDNGVVSHAKKIYLVMGPWDHYGGHEYFPYLMRRVFQVMGEFASISLRSSAIFSLLFD